MKYHYNFVQVKVSEQPFPIFTSSDLLKKRFIFAQGCIFKTVFNVKSTYLYVDL